jgi:large subunit ribosomal protein L6
VSRIGRMPIEVPVGVTIEIDSKTNLVKVNGPKGKLERTFSSDMGIKLDGKQLIVTRPDDSREHKAIHGLTRALLANMVTGVSAGFTKGMQVVGVGYRVETRDDTLILHMGYSHPVEIVPPPGVEFIVEKGGRDFQVSGIDREMVGHVAAKVRAVRKPEPYKGKGIRYKDEYVRMKAGKAGKAIA